MKFREETKSAISVTPYGLGYDLFTAYQSQASSDDLILIGEATIDAVSHSSLDDFSVSLSGIVSALYYLNSKIEAARKTVSYWDAYQIRGTITDRDAFLGQLAAMPANSSIASSLRNPFQWTDQNNETHTIYRGDIIIKDYLEQLHYIPSLNTGFYKPNSVTAVANNIYSINYIYETNAQATDTHLNFAIDGTFGGYNETKTIAARSTDNSINYISGVQPVVKIYLGGEQVFLDNTYSISNNRVVLNNTTSVSLVYEVK